MKRTILIACSIFSVSLAAQAQNFPDEMHMSTDGRMLLIGDLPNTSLYDQTQIRNIYLNFSQSDYWAQLDSNYWAWTQVEIPATMIVENVTYDSVGVRFRGQSSFQQIQTQDKKPFGISLDFVHPNQDIMGRKTMNLNNAFSDPSFIREMFYQHQLKHHIPEAKSSYVRLFLNGQYWGVYVNVQQLNKSYYKDWYQSAKGTSWRADRISGTVTPYGDGTGGLNYLGPDTSTYQQQYILKFTDKTDPWTDLVNTCDVLNNTPLQNLPALLPSKMDIDRTLWFLASEILFSDDDSYIQKGRMDYYVYWEKETGRIVPQEYDGNTVMNPNYQNWSPFYHEDSVNYPLMNRLFAVPEYRQRYLAHLRTLIKEYFTSSSADSIIDAYKAQIDTLVFNDPKKLYTYQDFQNEIPVLKNFITSRRNFLNSNTEVAEVAPTILNTAWYVNQMPWVTPMANQGATVRSSAVSSSGVYQMNMYYSNAIVGNFTKVQMFDDGLHDDLLQGDGIYGAALPGVQWGTWMRFYVEAVANNNARSVSYDPVGAEHNVYAYLLGTVGTEELSGEMSKMLVFPNPANSTVEIVMEETGEQELIIMNSTGQLVMQKKFEGRTNIDVSEFPAGLYMLQCEGMKKKLLVQH